MTSPAMSSVERWRLEAQQAQWPQQNKHIQQSLASNLPSATSLEDLKARAWVSVADKEKILISGWISAAKKCGDQVGPAGLVEWRLAVIGRESLNGIDESRIHMKPCLYFHF